MPAIRQLATLQNRRRGNAILVKPPLALALGIHSAISCRNGSGQYRQCKGSMRLSINQEPPRGHQVRKLDGHSSISLSYHGQSIEVGRGAFYAQGVVSGVARLNSVEVICGSNSVIPGSHRETGINRHSGGHGSVLAVAKLVLRNAQRGAA